MSSIRQEVLNVHLAELLCMLGLRAAAERIKRARKSPDLTLMHQMLGALLGEAEVGDTWADRRARSKLEKRALGRFSDTQFNYIDFILMLIYPRKLLQEASHVSEREITDVLRNGCLGVGLAYRAMRSSLDVDKGTEACYIWHPEPIYSTQIPAILERLAKKALGLLVKPEEIVEQIIELIEEASTYARNSAKGDASWLELWKKVAQQLEIDVEVLEDEVEGAYLAAKMLLTLTAVSMIIYEIARIRYPSKLTPLPIPLNFHAFSNALNRLREINYVEIVDLIRNEIKKVPSESTLVNMLTQLYRLISTHISVLMRSGWDALATIYQRLLSETYRKAYATFYTKLPAARLLAELAIETPKEKVVDPAGGTGSLLISSFYVRQWLALKPNTLGKMLDRAEPIMDHLSKSLLEKTYGMDALRVAVALSSGNLTIASLAIPHERLNMYPTPVGTRRAGSLDLLIYPSLMPKELTQSLGTFDLVIMNPPFTRSDRIPGLIGDEARDKLRKTSLMFGGKELENVFVAGLAKPFLALADKMLHAQGKIAAVLPTSLLNRPGWADVRDGIAHAYTIEYIVINWGLGTPNFSSDTQFREMLIVLKKGCHERPIKVVNLLEPVDNLDVGDITVVTRRAKESGGGSVTRIKDGQTKIVAKIAELPQTVVKKHSDNLYRLVAFLNPKLLEWHINLISECDTRLRDLFEVGSVVDHTTGLKIVSGAVSGGYPAIWGGGCESVAKPIPDKPTHSIIVESERKAKVKFWKKKPKEKTFYFGDLFILRRGQLDTQCVFSFKMSKPVVSNVWWPLRSKSGENETTLAFVAFMNSIFGFIHMLGERLETRGLYVEFKKTHLKRMPIPDFRKISKLTCIDALKSPMSRFDRYLEEMARIEEREGNWEKAIEYAITQQEEVASRAKLDKAVIVMLRQLHPKLKPPAKLYQLTHEDVKKLREIMESSSEDVEVIKDKGQVKIQKERHTPLDRWMEKT